MRQLKIPAAFMRGGTSNAIVFRQEDLPEDRELWSEIFIAAIGSPDPYGRQLNGMGGGISSLSKVCVVGTPTRPDADIDYTFAQVAVREAKVEYGGNCGNMSAAMGPFAVDEGMTRAASKQSFAFTTPIRRRLSKRISTSTIIRRRLTATTNCRALAGRGRRCGSIFWNQEVQLPANCCRPVIRSIP